MIDYAIYRFGYEDAKWLYPRLELKEGYMPTYIYIGFWDEMYVGYMAGMVENVDTINIQYTQLVPEFRGTKTVRIIKEIIKTIHEDFKNITTRVDFNNNDMIKILLNTGFHIRTDSNVELLRINE
ncbi:hypothetical protein LCGC14_1323470 [marine sediment metagenome]|uniref:N-acetyltransferase domain-containing protein n=1 Tax=marine sediment metagenome TaxID=412755 RepID=A0A0F9KIT7_9ZZZZ